MILCFIWGNSLLPASISNAISDWAKDVLNFILGGDSRETVLVHNAILRKVAHATEFAVLGVVLAILMGKALRRNLLFLILCGAAAALIDETLQLFSTGRASQLLDVWIDLCGYVLGLIFSWIVMRIASRSGNKRR